MTSSSSGKGTGRTCSVVQWPYMAKRSTRTSSNALDETEERRMRVAWFVGQRLRGARQDAGLSVRDLAVSLNLFSEEIEDFETGRVALPSDLLPDMCRLFGKPLSFWFDSTTPS